MQSLLINNNKLRNFGLCLSNFISFTPELQILNMAQNDLNIAQKSCKTNRTNNIKEVYLQNNEISDVRDVMDIVNCDMDVIILSTEPLGHNSDIPDLDKSNVGKLQEDIIDFSINHNSGWPVGSDSGLNTIETTLWRVNL